MSGSTEPVTTTRFTPPLNCFDPTWRLSPVGDDIQKGSGMSVPYWTDLPNGHRSVIPPTTTESMSPKAMAKAVTPSCFPSSPISDNFRLGFRRECPWGYTSLGTQLDPYSTETTFCCPTFMGNEEDYQQGKNSMTDANMRTRVWKDPYLYPGTWYCAFYYEGNPAHGLEMPVTGSMGLETWRVVTFFHSPIQMTLNRKQSSPPTTTPTPMTLSSTSTVPTSSDSALTAATSPARDMPLEDIVGIAVGTAVATAILFAFVAWLLLRQRRKRNHAMFHKNPSALNRFKDEKAEHEDVSNSDSRGISEAASLAVRRKVELSGDWHGTEAPAPIEVDLSRPQWKETAANAVELESPSTQSRQS